ncbi:hypothetical protein CAPTEDRAFT_225780 [Capitella teleta]|uniref:Glycosyl hydrolase family 13 catalytic domain-containing protein n=1 Tax=Capitella teleta TaxID=283909 RepID=R7T6W3_CAPTE|nr:hypothetical protein CAPTEDRAFT_225780 [Capitella teleta]|eukprot:ELT89339.1 hypothetical protein CAPTEDRAFT_225780 [Capitella teleta]
MSETRMRRANGSQPPSDRVQVVWSDEQQYHLEYSGQGEKMPLRDTIVMLMFAGSLISLVPILALGIAAPESSSESLWWKNGVVYEVEPVSFADGNGDAYGDFQGLIAKLPYIRDLGVSAIRLNPIFRSQLSSETFDISDYRDINPVIANSIDEFDQLVSKIHEFGLHLLLDLVPNHSSDNHAWFNASRHRQSPYDDFYVWHGGIRDSAGGRQSPNNWLTVDGQSAWTWDDSREQFYLHQFSQHQPDLNWRSENLQKQFLKVITFWMKHGVDGFHMWNIDHLVEAEDLTKSEPEGRPLFTQHQPENVKITSSWRKHMDSIDPNSVLLLDVKDTESLMAKWASYQATGVMPANRLLSEQIALECGGICVNEVIERISRASYHLPFNYTVTWALGEINLPRVAYEHGRKTASALQMLQMTLPGMASTCSGEELGLTDSTLSWTQRPLMPWFKSSGDDRSVEEQEPDRLSPLSVYKQLTRLRQEPAFKSIRMNTTVINENVYSFVRYAVGKFYTRYLVAVNLGLKESEDDYVMQAGPVAVPQNATLLVANFPTDLKIVNLKKLRLKPGDGVVVEFPSNTL